MAQQLQQQLRDVGSKLESPPSSKDSLIKLLKQAANVLAELDQSPLPPLLDSMKPCLNAFSKADFLKHQDRDVKVLVATCICEITRITAPEAPYSDDVLRDIFELIVDTFGGLGDVDNPSFGRRVVILETLARYRSCVVMLDLECHDLIDEMFNRFLLVVSDKHPENVLSSMQKIMILILDESEDIQENILTSLLSVLGRHRNDVSQAARKLAMTVIERCAGKLEPSIQHYLVSSLSGNSSYLEISADHHEVIYDIYQCAPQILYGIFPYITGELLTDKLDVRRKAVQLLGDLFSSPGCTISERFQPLWSEFLKRLTDRVAEIRVSVVEHVKKILMSNTTGAEASQIIGALSDRLLDFDENVRKQVVAAICDVACASPEVISTNVAKQVAERLRDKSLSVKRYTMERLADLYRIYSLKNIDCSIENDEYGWIPGRLLRCLYDKDFRSESIEFALCGSLFPVELPVKDRVKYWLSAFSLFDKVETKALEQILAQKQRLYQELQKYLSLRQTFQEGDTPDSQKKIFGCFRSMSRLFSDSATADESFQMLHNLKDANIWRLLTRLLDPCSTYSQTWACRSDLLRILGERHPLYDFLGLLSIKCSYMLFNHEFVKEILSLAAEQHNGGNSELLLSCMNLLKIISYFLPPLLAGCEEDLVSFLKTDNDLLKEGITHVLAKAGGAIREKLVSMPSSVELMLERLCLEGTRKQAKYSVLALAAITKDEGLMSLSVLYKRIVDVLEEKTHLPAILQSLGCIAQIAMPIFETREEEIVEFIMNKILSESRLKTDDGSKNKNGYIEESDMCSLKIFSIKTLVKSYLPSKDALVRPGIDKLVETLKKILRFGNISEEIESSPLDKAILKLASAKAILRLSRLCDDRIPIDVFYMTLRTSEDHPEFRRLFLNKVSQYIKERLLEAKFACTFLLNMSEFGSSEFKEAKQNLMEIVQVCRQHKARQLSIQNDLSSAVSYPEFILVYFVHALAHHPSCPSIECKETKLFESIYRRLHLLLSVLLLEGDGWQSDSPDKKKESLVTVCSIFNTIKRSKDVVDVCRTKTSHVLSELGLAIVRNIVRDQFDCLEGSNVHLPSILYKSSMSDDEISLGNNDYEWLCGASSIAYFEALDAPRKEAVKASATNNNADLAESDGDGSEMPLGKMMKILKSHGGKRKNKARELGSSLSVKKPDTDDVLDLVREINLGNVDGDDAAEISNFKKGDEDFTGTVLSGKNENEKFLVSPKRKREKTEMLLDFPTPKRKRTPVANRPILKSTKGLIEFGGSRSTNSDLLSSCSPATKSVLSGNRKKDLKKAHFMQDIVEPAKFTHSEVTDMKLSSSKSFTGAVRKRKRRSIAGLEKCSSRYPLKNEEELIGLRIKVWWPIDKQFYEGVVQSYDEKKKKHEVLYDDGDTEVLNLGKEKWEPVANGCTVKKRPMSQVASPLKTPSNVKRNSKEHTELDTENMSGSNTDTNTVSRDGSGLSHTQPCSASEVEDDARSVGSKDKEPTPPLRDEEQSTSANLGMEAKDEDEPDSPGYAGMEDSDDEPLIAWKLRTGKTH